MKIMPGVKVGSGVLMYMCSNGPCRFNCTHNSRKKLEIKGIVFQPEVIILHHIIGTAGGERGADTFNKSKDDLHFTGTTTNRAIFTFLYLILTFLYHIYDVNGFCGDLVHRLL